MFEVVAYPAGAAPFVVVQTDDREEALRVYCKVGQAFIDQGLPTDCGLDRRDPTAPDGWREIRGTRPGPRPSFDRTTV